MFSQSHYCGLHVTFSVCSHLSCPPGLSTVATHPYISRFYANSSFNGWLLRLIGIEKEEHEKVQSPEGLSLEFKKKNMFMKATEKEKIKRKK